MPLGTRAAAVGCSIGRLYPKAPLAPAFLGPKFVIIFARVLAETRFGCALSMTGRSLPPRRPATLLSLARELRSPQAPAIPLLEAK